VFILEEPFVSDYLANTVAVSGRPVLDNAMARSRLDHSSAELLPSPEFARRAALPGARLYTNSENSINWIAENLGQTDLPRQIHLLKDKLAFRELLSEIYPGYAFRELSLEALDDFDPAIFPKPFVIKPAVGFFSVAVHVVQSDQDWPEVAAALRADAARSLSLYPDKVLGLDRFILEEVIEGEEFAIDVYFTDEGEAVVLNVMAHHFTSGMDVGDRVYYTSPSLMERWRAEFERYLRRIGRLAKLRNFPIHAELRVGPDGQIAPIEINPMRFGGWCAADMSWYAFGFDPYTMYLEDARPDWPRLLEKRRGKACGLIVADIPSEVPAESIESVDYDAFLSRFSRPLDLRRTDFNRHPVFAFLFVEVPEDEMSELQNVLHADLRQYLRVGAGT